MSDTATLERVLKSLRNGKSRKVRGFSVRRLDDQFEIDDETYSLSAAVQFLSESASREQRGPNYARTAYLEKPPCSRGVLRTHQVRSKAEHTKLVEEVKKRGNYLWMAAVVERDGKFYAVEPHIVDWDSIPEHPADTKAREEKERDPKNWDGGLSCPFCRKGVTSTPGRTLHVKSQHPDRFDEYMRLLAGKPGTGAAAAEAKDEDDVVDRLEESGEGEQLKCPFCDKKVSSTPGRTNHVKGKHPDRWQEYFDKYLKS